MNTPSHVGGLLTTIRTVLGGGAIAITFGAAIALACLVLGLVLRAILELAWAATHAAVRLTEFAGALVQ